MAHHGRARSRKLGVPEPSSDVWEVLATARSIRRFTDQPVDEATLSRCLEAATWAPNGANKQTWRFVVLRSPALWHLFRLNSSQVTSGYTKQLLKVAARRSRCIASNVTGRAQPGQKDIPTSMTMTGCGAAILMPST